MAAPLTRRLAGVRFEDRTPELPEKLPRMDIAIFVGFASAGPLHRPVPLEAAAEFAELFGGDLPLAWDLEKGARAFANLAPAVRAFFRNGGKRCWVIRVAEATEASFFPVPGLIQVEGGELGQGFARGRSPGSWFDALRVGAALTSRAIEVLGWSTDFRTLDLWLAPRDALRGGDLVRLTSADARQQAFFIVESAAPALSSPPETRRQRFEARVQLLGSLRSLMEHELPPGQFSAEWARLPNMIETATGDVFRHSPPETDSARITLDNLEPGFRPPPGILLRLEFGTGELVWFHVDETQLDVDSGSPPGRGGRLVGHAFSWSSGPPSPGSLATPRGEKLTFELRVQRGETVTRMGDLGFALAHPRFWNALPNDADLFGEIEFRHAIESKSAQVFEALWLDAGEPRFPLAGDRGVTGAFIPIAMSALGQPSLAPQHDGRSALERDGLVQFSWSIFLDPRLVEPSATTLLAEAEFIRFQTPRHGRQTSKFEHLLGIHAALEIEEATLIAVPDATHRGWRQVAPPSPSAPVPSQPRDHPSWWHFLECDPPASPPSADRPYFGKFLDCALRVLAAPFLELIGPDASGAIMLRWTGDAPDVEFILEEATEPNFAGASELRRGPQTSHTILTRTPGHYYYRVRAEADGESSNWSNEVVAAFPLEGRWRVENAESFQPDALLDVHRALLRLCAARGDIMAVLSLPEHFREDDALTYLAQLRSMSVPGAAPRVFPLHAGEVYAFSYAAAYHPWIIVREEAGGLVTTPPEGAVAGVIARRSLARGAWIAPANELLSGVVALAPRIASLRHLDLLLAQLNLIRQEPQGFLALSADTLSDDPDLRPINVRRLLILLRRAALRLGMTYVFEPNDATLRRVVQGAFESLLRRLFVRGAFAGPTPETAFQVITDDTINTPQRADLGRFHVDLKVAPSLPMSFVTIRLVQLGERAAATELF